MDSFCHSQLYKASPSQWRASVNLMRPINLLCLRWEWDHLSPEMRGVQNLLCLRWEWETIFLLRWEGWPRSLSQPEDFLSQESSPIRNPPQLVVLLSQKSSSARNSPQPGFSSPPQPEIFLSQESSSARNPSQPKIVLEFSSATLWQVLLSQESSSARNLSQPEFFLS